MTSRPVPKIWGWQGELPQACHPFFPPPPLEQGLSWPPEVEGRAEVAVVGAGLSGLAAAYDLRDRQVLVLEAGEAVGGVCQPGFFRGVAYPAGSAYFYYPEEAAGQQWYRNLGLPLDEALVPEPVSALLFQGRWFPRCFSPEGLRRLPLGPAAVDGFLRLAEDLAEWEERWDPLGSDTLSRPELDRLSLAHYLEEVRGLPPEVTRILAPYCRSCLGAGPENISAWAGIFFLMAEFSPTTRAAAFPEGNARIARVLAEALPQPPLLRQTVVGLEPRPESVHLLVWDGREGRPRRFEAGAAILAVGKFAARHLLAPGCGWSPGDFEKFRYSSYLVAALGGALSLNAPGFENWVVGEAAFSDFILSPRAFKPGEPRVMVVFAPQPYPQGRPALLSAHPEDKARELLASLGRLLPGTAGQVEEVFLYRFGHAQVVPYPGFLTALKSFPRQRGRLVLAHSDLEGLPCVEAAIVQGQHAARRARALLEG